MKKRLILGDMHGLWDNYLEIYNYENPDEVICLGDYLDSFTVSHARQEYGVKELFHLQASHHLKNKGKFIILLGNHDFHYLYGYPSIEKYSGFSYHTLSWACLYLNEMLKQKRIKAVYIDYKNKIIYSHAGISNTWINEWNLKLYDINDLLDNQKMDPFMFTHKEYDPYGDSIYSSCLWIRPSSLHSDMYKDENGEIWKQIVGHTPIKSIENTEDLKLFVCDAIPYKYYLLHYFDDNDNFVKEEICHLG